ncbi:hypothetical protein BB561_003182 [Smittium simulii]|uniref:Uncharacterized protein n=1 Tax=Smittium simulii TaxID=133385 RepID=A0A2T9YMM5_9FUNG|nr:hypothetical protein BB561_003182 [Smittium simulii]
MLRIRKLTHPNKSLFAPPFSRLLHGWGAYLHAFNQNPPNAASNFSGRLDKPLLSPTKLSLESFFPSFNIQSSFPNNVAVGYGHSLIAVYNSSMDVSYVSAFGLNRYSQLGSKTSHNPALTAYEIKGCISQISCGREHTLLLSTTREDNTCLLYSFGNNSHGQLGLLQKSADTLKASLSNKNLLIQKVSAPYSNIEQIACGLDHSIILTKRGELFTFGWNADGQLGNNTDNSSHQPCNISNYFDSKVLSVSTSTDLNFALTQNNQLYVWGNGEYMNNMLQSTQDKIVIPTKVDFDFGQIMSFAAGGAHSLVANNHGEVFICGYGALGFGSSEIRLSTPTKIPHLKDIVSVYASTDYSAAKDANGKYYIWGLNNKSGILGLGHTNNQFKPAPLLFDSTVDTKNSKLALGNLFSFLY